MKRYGDRRKGGRKPKPYPNNWTEVYEEWLSGNLSSMEASRLLDLSYGTFYNMAERYEIQNGIVRERNKTARKSKFKGLDRVAAIKGPYAYLARKYSDYLERNILSRIDYQKLQESYYTEDMEYAKGIFNLLHQAMVRIYGSDTILDPDDSVENSLVLIPGVVSRAEMISLALLVVNLAGEVRSVDLLTKYGCCMKVINEEILPGATSFICGYTAILPRNDFCVKKQPAKAQALLMNFIDSTVRLLCSWKNS